MMEILITRFDFCVCSERIFIGSIVYEIALGLFLILHNLVSSEKVSVRQTQHQSLGQSVKPVFDMKFSLTNARGNLYFSVFAANLASLAVGTHYGWTSPTLPKLESADSWLPVDDEESSWIGSIICLSSMFGPFLGGWLINVVGRRSSIFTSVVMSTIAWTILIFSRSVWHIYAGRFIAGLAGGMVFLAVPTYVAEISETEVRSALGSLFAFFMVGGYMIEYACGPYLSYQNLIIINFVPALLFLPAFSFIPESPYFSLRKGLANKAFESLSWLRTSQTLEAVESEMNEIKAEVARSMTESVKLSDLFVTRGSRMALFLSCTMVGGQQLSGVNVILFYGQTIFEMAGSSVSSSLCQIIIGSILFICGAFAIPLTRYFGMKNLLVVSAAGMSFFQAALGLYFYLFSTGQDMSGIGWLPLGSVMSFILIYAVGFGPLPWVIMAEVFPTQVKALGSAITTAFCWFVSFLLTKFFIDIVDFVGMYIPYLFFSVSCVVSLLLTVFFLPETRGKTLQEIQDLLNKESSNTRDIVQTTHL